MMSALDPSDGNLPPHLAELRNPDQTLRDIFRMCSEELARHREMGINPVQVDRFLLRVKLKCLEGMRHD